MILALRALGLGDLLTAVPALRALKRARPDEPLVLAAPGPLRPLVALGGLADRMVAVDAARNHPPGPLPSSVKPVRTAVNLHGQGPQSTEALVRVRPAQLWSYGVPGAPPWDPDEHEVRRWCRLVAHHGCPADETDLFLRPRPAQGHGVLIHPGAASAERRWPPDRFAAVAASLAALGHHVTVTAGPGEEPLAGQVAGEAGVAIGAGLNLRSLAALVESSALVVCGDTGIAHLATALRTPSVVLFGPQPPSRWGPPPVPWHRVLWHSCAGNAPDRPHPALLRIGVPEVLAEATTALTAGTYR